MDITSFLKKVDLYILNPIILLLFSVATVYFIYSVVNYLRLDPSDSERKEAFNSIIWSIVGIFIMLSVYGIINFVLSTFGVSASTVPFIKL